MKLKFLRLLVILAVGCALQGCVVAYSQMLFNPAVRAAFIIPREVTPTTAIRIHPRKYNGRHIAVTGAITEISDEEIVVDDYVIVRVYGDVGHLAIGDRVSYEGKLVFPAFSRKNPRLRYAQPFRPIALSPADIGTQSGSSP